MRILWVLISTKFFKAYKIMCDSSSFVTYLFVSVRVLVGGHKDYEEVDPLRHIRHTGDVQKVSRRQLQRSCMAYDMYDEIGKQSYGY